MTDCEDHDDEDVEPKNAKERRCIASGQSLPVAGLIRFVVGPDNSIVPDLQERLPGRGFWLSADPDMIHKACAKKLFTRAARQQVTVSETLADEVKNLLVRRCLNHIALARRAGQVVAGYDRVTDKLRKSPGRWRGGILCEASDGAEGGRQKVERLASELTLVDFFTSEELGGAIGTERTVHMVIEPGGLARKLVRDIRRLAGFFRATENGNE